MSAAAATLQALAARAYYLQWLVASHPALAPRDAASATRVAASLYQQCGVIAAGILSL